MILNIVIYARISLLLKYDPHFEENDNQILCFGQPPKNHGSVPPCSERRCRSLHDVKVPFPRPFLELCLGSGRLLRPSEG